MLLGRDAEAVLAYAQECDEQGRALSAKATSSPSRLAATASRVVEPVVGPQASGVARRQRRSLVPRAVQPANFSAAAAGKE